MALKPAADYLLDTGELDPDWFVVPPTLAATYASPQAFLLGAIPKWQAEGLSRVDGTLGPAAKAELQEAAADEWAYVRAYQLLISQKSERPGTQSLGELARSWQAEQIKSWKESLARHLAAYEALASQPLVPLSDSAVTQFTRGEEQGGGEYVARRIDHTLS